MKYSYTLDPKNIRPRLGTYRLVDLQGMTLMQLQDICQQEIIIHEALDRLDREELIQLIMTFRGSREQLLIKEYSVEGAERLQKELRQLWLVDLPYTNFSIPSKISLFEGLATGFFDDYRLTYKEELDGVNAFILDQEGGVCAVLRLVSFPGHEELFLTRLAEISCREAEVRNYRLLLCPQKLSDRLTAIYNGEELTSYGNMQAYVVPLLSYEVCTPGDSPMPLAIDFGTSNTAAGAYLGRSFYSGIEHHLKPGLLKPDSINYLQFQNLQGEVLPLLPTVIAVESIEGEEIVWRYGFAAEGMMAQGYLGQGVCAFYDIKRWAADFEEMETLTDSKGRKQFWPRKKIIRAYLDHIIKSAEQRFKCKFKKLFLSYPVKQRERFISLYRELFPDYDILEGEMFDEGIAVLYDVISGFMDGKNYQEEIRYHALILDCGGGTTDQSSVAFRIKRGRAAYEIEIEASYENGDTDFGGNNLTFRIMQLLKIEAARQLVNRGKGLAELMANFSFDQYRIVDDHGREDIYRELEEVYAQAESVIPTRYREYEYSGKEEYYKVYNNFHYLFTLAEEVKKTFFANDQVFRIVVSSLESLSQPDTIQIKAQRWKLAAHLGKELKVQKHFPPVSINTHQVRAVLKADIYDIFRRFVGRLYREKQLSQYGIVKLTGQSCKIDLFRDCLKEYVPGVLIRQGQSLQTDNYQLKLTCLGGAIRYLRDKTLGLTRVNISYGRPALPYILSAYTHDGEKITLIHPLDRENVAGTISRNIASTEVEFTLSDTQGQEKFVYNIASRPESFSHVTYEQIEEEYGEHIPQPEVDIIENDEVRYFVWADAGAWGFAVVPVSRRDEELYLGSQQLRSFENESWMVNYFDGMH